ncbi:hypothetical protein [Gordonia sp. FQ]|uniref:hypothetical protein n=1 Tax=Gordonia sp. FQ TaxID=3446634 RepID=UPI003F87DF0E
MRKAREYIEPGADPVDDARSSLRVTAVWAGLGIAVLVGGLVWFVVAAITGPASAWSTDDPGAWVGPLAAVGSGLLVGGPGCAAYYLARRDLRELDEGDDERRRLRAGGRRLDGVVESIEPGRDGWELVVAIGDPAAKRTRRYTRRYYSVPDEVPAVGEKIAVFVDRDDPGAYMVDVP